MATQVQQDFEKLVRAFLANAEAYRPLVAFIKERQTKELFYCISTYFQISRDYGEKHSASLTVFRDLVLTLLTKGDCYIALRIESLMVHGDTPWRSRYLGLSTAHRSALAGQIRRQKAALSSTQKLFLEKFTAHMKRRDDKTIESFIYKLKFAQLNDCLLAYIEVSQQFADDHETSLVTFYALSFRTLALGDSYFAAQYESRVRSTGSIWKARYDGLKSWQRDDFLEPAIKERKKIVSVTKYEKKDPEGNRVPVNVTQKQSINVKIPSEPSQPEDQRRRSPQTALQREFERSFDEYMSRDGKNKRDDEFINSIYRRNFNELRQLMHTYLQASTRYDDGNLRSLGIFMLIGATAIAKGDAYYAFKFKFNIEKGGTLWERRFRSLDNFLGRGKWGQDQITNEIRKKERRARIIDNLKFAFFLKNQTDPSTEELRNLEVAVSEEQDLMLAKILDSCSYAFESPSIADFSSAFDRLSVFLKAQKDPLLTYGLLQRCYRKTSMVRNLRLQLTWYIAGALYIQALIDRPEAYKRGFDQEEGSFLFSEADRRTPYFDDFVYRLDFLWLKYQSHDEFTKLYKASILLHVFARSFGMTLVPLEEAAAVHGFINLVKARKPEFLEAIRIPINSTRTPGKTLKIDETIGKIFIVWWDPEGAGEAYVQVEGFEGILFNADSYWRLGKFYDDDAIYGEIYRNTKHILVIMPVFFQFLGYLPDLVTGGLSGLAKAYFFDLALEKSAKALGLDSTSGQFLLMGAAMLARHAVPIKTKVAVTGIEAGATSVERRGTRTLPDDTSTANKLGGGPTSKAGGTPDTGSTGQSRSGVDMRGVERNEGHVIRGDVDAAPKAFTHGDLNLAEQRLKEANIKLDSAKKEMDGKQKRVGDLEANVEEAQGKRYLPERVKELETAKRVEREAVAKYREQKWNVRGAQSNVDRITTDLRNRGELAHSLGNKWNLPAKPGKYKVGDVEGESWLNDVYLGTSQNRPLLERLLKQDRDGDLSKCLLDKNGRLFNPKVGKMPHWKAHPELIEMAHVLSKREKGREVVIVMTKARNQEFGRRFEHTGGIFKDEAIVIQGIAIDRMSAQDLVKRGLPQTVVDKARVIRF